MFKVTSHDYGGKAYLRAALTLASGVAPIYAEVVDGTAQDVAPPANNAATTGTCGADFAQHPFASLPVDQDCNGIADGWEGQYTTPLGGHLDPAADNEQGYGANPNKGDGWSVHDEYRGFHYIQDAVNTADLVHPNGVVMWTSTDPVKMQDVFFWDSFVPPSPNGIDPCVSPQYSPPANPQWSTLNPNCVTTAVRGMLAHQTSAFIEFRRVNPFQAGAVSTTDPTQGTHPLNKNTQYTSKGFALVYGIDLSPSGATSPAQCDASPPVLGLLADSGGFSNDGTMINILLPQAIACAYVTRPSPGSAYPQDMYLQRIVAHETGHKFGLYHINRFLTFSGSWHSGQLFPRLSDLSFTGYDIDDQVSGTMYLRYNNIPYFRWDSRANTSTPATLHETLEGNPICFSAMPPTFLPVGPTSSSEIYQLSYCAPSLIPRKAGPAPSGECAQRYATQKHRDTGQLNYLLVHATTLERVSRGRASQGTDIMGLFSPSVTGYAFDSTCELPHLRVVDLPN